MSFNNMRKLTKSADQVIKAIKDSKVVELSSDDKWIRKKLPNSSTLANKKMKTGNAAENTIANTQEIYAEGEMIL
jgi:hypothetical protein